MQRCVRVVLYYLVCHSAVTKYKIDTSSIKFLNSLLLLHTNLQHSETPGYYICIESKLYFHAWLP